MLKEFRDFAMRGNVIDLAVGIIIAAAKAAGAATLNYGLFINAVVNFLIVAFAVFILVRQVNRWTAKFAPTKDQAPPTPEAKDCPYCLSSIPLKATRCPHCTSQIA